MDAARERFPLEALEHLTRLAVELTVEYRLHPINRFGCSAVLQQRELVAYFGRKQIDSGGRDLSELHVYPPAASRHAPQPHAFGHRRAFLASVRIEEGAETLSLRDADQLLVAPGDAHAGAARPAAGAGPRRDPPARQSPTSQGARAGRS